MFSARHRTRNIAKYHLMNAWEKYEYNIKIENYLLTDGCKYEKGKYPLYERCHSHEK